MTSYNITNLSPNSSYLIHVRSYILHNSHNKPEMADCSNVTRFFTESRGRPLFTFLSHSDYNNSVCDLLSTTFDVEVGNGSRNTMREYIVRIKKYEDLKDFDDDDDDDNHFDCPCQDGDDVVIIRNASAPPRFPDNATNRTKIVAYLEPVKNESFRRRLYVGNLASSCSHYLVEVNTQETSVYIYALFSSSVLGESEGKRHLQSHVEEKRL